MTAGRWRATDAFVDESMRSGRYLLACVLTDARDLPSLRASLTGLLRPRQRRLHFHNESPGRRRALLTAFASMPVRLLIVTSRATHGFDDEAARDACLGLLVAHLQRVGVERLVLESRDDDRGDARTIIRARQSQPPLVFEHRAPAAEPVLWLADGAAWAAGLGGELARLLGPITDRILELRP